MLFGNFFVYMAFKEPTIEQHTRLLVTIVLSAVCGIGCVLMFLLRPAISASGIVLPQRSLGPIQAFVEAVRVMKMKEMALLCITFFYTGKALTDFIYINIHTDYMLIYMFLNVLFKLLIIK